MDFKNVAKCARVFFQSLVEIKFSKAVFPLVTYLQTLGEFFFKEREKIFSVFFFLMTKISALGLL